MTPHQPPAPPKISWESALSLAIVTVPIPVILPMIGATGVPIEQRYTLADRSVVFMLILIVISAAAFILGISGFRRSCTPGKLIATCSTALASAILWGIISFCLQKLG